MRMCTSLIQSRWNLNDVPWTVRGHIERLNWCVWFIKLADSSECRNSQVGLSFLFQSTTTNHSACNYYGKTANMLLKKLVLQHF